MRRLRRISILLASSVLALSLGAASCFADSTTIDGEATFNGSEIQSTLDSGEVVKAFNDLQPAKGTVTAVDGAVTVAVPAKSMTFLTTDYEDRVPAAVVNGRIANGVLSWTASKEPEHCYYRVYRDGKQIASTVATVSPSLTCVPSATFHSTTVPATRSCSSAVR